MGVDIHGVAPPSPCDLHPSDVRRGEIHRSDVRRSLTVSAKLAMCLQPEFDHVSVTVVDPTGDPSTWAQDGELASAFDQLQRDLGEGPGRDTASSAECVVAPRIRHDDRWGRYGRAAAELGLRSQVSAPLQWRDEPPMGALNMYSTTDDRVALTAPLVAQVMAAQVASALAGLQEIETLRELLTRVTDELSRRYEPPSARPA